MVEIWGFKQQTEDGNITAPAVMTLAAADINTRVTTANAAAHGLHDATLNAHINYWNSTAPGQIFEFFRYDAGWWNSRTDAQTFFTARVNGLVPGGNGGDKIGVLDLWVRK